MSMRKLSLILVWTTVWLGGGVVSTPIGLAAQPVVYPLSERAGFIHGCLDLDEKSPEPVTEEQVKYCLCVLDLLQTKYTYDQFVKLYEAYEQKQPRAVEEFEGFFKNNTSICL